MGKCILTFVLLFASPVVLADGMVFSLSARDFSSAVPVTEEIQQAIIAHENGREGMLLAVNFNLEDDEKAFWLFPVPGRPEDVKADVVDTFPPIEGIRPGAFAHLRLRVLFDLQMLSQPYTWPFMCLMSSLGKAGMDLNVHSVVEKHGLRIETLSAETTGALAAHLKEKEINISEPELAAFSDYLSEQYSLVFVEIASREELLRQFPDYEHYQREDQGRWPCVFVEFPSEKIFFPLKPTASYQESLRIIVKVLEFVKNERELNDSWKSGFYQQTNTDALPNVFKPYITGEPLCYTVYDFSGDAAELTDDLWMEPFVPKRVRYAQYINTLFQFGGGWAIIVPGAAFFLLQSWGCAGLAGLIFYRKWKPYAVLGLGNIVTLYGVYLLARYSKDFPETEPPGGEPAMKSFRLHRPGPKEIHRSHFLFLFSLLFLVSSIIFYVLSTLPLHGT